MSFDFLPDSRARIVRGAVPINSGVGEGDELIDIFCASCSKPWGRVARKNCTFAFATCNDCDAKYGVIAHLMHEPDTVFWARVHEEQEAKKLTPLDFQKQLEDPSSVLSRIAADWRKAHGFV